MCLLAPLSARADIPFHAGELTCAGNRAVVRVGWGAVGNGAVVFPELPASVTPLNAPPEGGHTCTLDDGRELRVKLGFEQQRPYGVCGGALNSVLSLWVGGRKVLSRFPALRACFSKGHADIVLLAGDTLTLCRSPASVMDLIDSSETAGCTDVSDLLAAALPDPVEYPPDRRAQAPVGTVQITQNARPGLCELFLALPKTGEVVPEAFLIARSRDMSFNPVLWQRSDFVDESQFRTAAPPLPDFILPAAAAPLAFQNQPSTLDHKYFPPFLSWLEADFDNDGAADLVLRTQGRSGADDSDVYTLAKGASADLIKMALIAAEPAQHPTDIKGLMALLSAPGVYSYADGEGRPVQAYQSSHAYQLAFVAGGETLVFAAKINRRDRPTAVIYKPLPGGTSEQVCVYQRIEDNF